MGGEKPVTDYRIARFESDRIYQNINLEILCYKLLRECVGHQWENLDMLDEERKKKFCDHFHSVFTRWNTAVSWNFLHNVKDIVKEVYNTLSQRDSLNESIRANRLSRRGVFKIEEIGKICDEYMTSCCEKVRKAQVVVKHELGLLNKTFAEDSYEYYTMELIDEVGKILCVRVFDCITPALSHGGSFKFTVPFFLDCDNSIKNRYVLHKGFFKEFTVADFSKVRGDALPDGLHGLVKLPVSVCVREDSEKGVYHYIDEFNFVCSRSEGIVSLNLQAPVQSSSRDYETGDYIVDILELSSQYQDDHRIKDALEHKLSATDVDKLYRNRQKHLENTQFIFGEDWLLTHSTVETMFTKIIVYLNTGTPDIRSFKNTIRYNKKQKGKKYKKTIKKEDLMLCPYPIFLVGYNWKKGDKVSVCGAEYATESWHRQGGWVNQPYGKGRSERRWQYRQGTTCKRSPELLSKMAREKGENNGGKTQQV